MEIPIHQSLDDARKRASEFPQEAPLPSDSYCDVCGKYTSSGKKKAWLKSEVRFADLEREDGECEVCFMVSTGLKRYQEERGLDSPLPEYVAIRCDPGISFYVQRPESRTSEKDILGHHGLEFYIEPGAFTTLKHIGIGQPVHKDLASENCMLLAQSWIKTCKETHSRCRQPAQTKLPTRVIDVGSEHQLPFLRETKDAEGQYFTLSHCWGKAQPLTTKSATLEERKKGIPLESLPKTFLDAVMITRRLGAQYIWIDSLCIIQDSSSDWEIESASMGQIYRRSSLTIAATSAEDGRVGCFVEKENWRESIPVEVHDTQGISNTVFIREREDDLHDVLRNFRDEPLSIRAWVLQERILSTRILLYTRSELVFECNSDSFCECGEYPLRRSYAAYANTGRLGPFLLPNVDNPSSDVQNDEGQMGAEDRANIFKYWKDLVEGFTDRLLTYDSDVLPALSGLASMVQRKLTDDYLAGIWRNDLPMGLLWSISRPAFTLNADSFELLKSLDRKEIHPRILPYMPRRVEGVNLPTWSWASIRGSTSYRDKWLDPDCELYEPATVVHVSDTLASENTTGYVEDVSLTISGYVKPIKLGLHEWHRESLRHRCRAGEITCPDSHDHTEQCISYNLEEWVVLDLPPDKCEDIWRKEFWRLRIGLKLPVHDVTFIDYAGRFLPNADAISRTHVVHYYLILHRSTRGEGLYERVGFYIKTVFYGYYYEEGEITEITIV
ncbi:HET-domain-containing protein [Glonium stellatum]|uniref:HET-domain-containing protein n=1 Tax=Glonium stellatum TaxID=574774 RepID=A0A8E2FBG7_9PEZI|nr:HET-domain-containing protein [Glonium stellatum]